MVRFDLPLLGDISGLRGVHLQCHIGTDTISLARLGASMTGVDFSGPAVAQARGAGRADSGRRHFVESDVYEAADVVRPGGSTSSSPASGRCAGCPSVSDGREVVADVLRPGGRLFIREGHPMLWALDDARDDDLLVVDYPYFERDEPTIFDEGGTYVETDMEFEHTITHEWNHGLGEIVSSLLDAGMTITGLTEHDSVPWDASARPHGADRRGGEWRLKDRPWRLPHSYTLQAREGLGRTRSPTRRQSRP